jgi:hypothetical protein
MRASLGAFVLLRREVQLSYPSRLSLGSIPRRHVALAVLLAAAGFAGAWAVGGQAGVRAATTLPNPDPPPTRPATPPPPPPPAVTAVAPPPPPVQTYAPPPPPPPPPAAVRPRLRPAARRATPPRLRLHAPTVAHLQRPLTPPSRALAAYPVALGPSAEPDRLVPLVLLALVLLVPLSALALVVAPTQRLPDRTAAMIEQRRETLMALGLVGIVGIAIGIGIALVGL